MAKQDKYTKSARGQPCQVRIPGICKPAPDNETTVLAHLNGGGMAFKNGNIHAAYACDCCHEWLDHSYAILGASRDRRDLYHLQAVIRTQVIMINDGILVL